MKSAKLWGALAALVTLLAPGTAHAQIFTTYDPFAVRAVEEPGAPPPDVDDFRRLHIGAFGTLWDFPAAGLGVPGASLELDADPGVLLSVDYFLTKNLSVGGWWNTYGGSIDLITPGATTTLVNYDAQYWDVHATFHLPAIRGLGTLLGTGWSFQAGYSQINYELRGVRPFFRGEADVDFDTFNFWLNKSWNLGGLNIGGSRRAISLFTNFGWMTEDEYFDEAFNIIAGLDFAINDRLSISGSVWFNDPGDDMATRGTLGLVSRF